MSESKYAQRGVSYDKKEVHQAIEGLSKGLYPKAFCKILPDYVAGDPEYCNIMHADTAGTKTALAYLYWKETGDVSIWKGIVQDAMVMNLDDMACVGCTGPIVLSSTIGRNKNLITGEVIATIIQFADQWAKELSTMGIAIELAGGETADVGDIVRTIDVGYTAFARLKRENLLVNNIQAGDVIVGLSSSGQASYESSYNSGIGSNGLTSARHDVLNKALAKKYPEAWDPNTDHSVVFTGSKNITDTWEDYTVGQLLLSPTRTYLPFLEKLFREGGQEGIRGMIHCTGGAQTKVLHFIDQLKIVKSNLLEIPPVFRMIQAESQTDWKEMYQVFNMGHRLEIYGSKEKAGGWIKLAQSFNIDAQIIGQVEAAEVAEVELHSPHGKFSYFNG